MKGVKYYRLAKGLTQAALARAMGVDQSVISDWETGRSSPSSGRLPRLAELLGVTIDQLFSGPEEAPGERAG